MVLLQAWQEAFHGDNMAQLPLIEDGIKGRDLGQNYSSHSDQWLPAQAYDDMAIADLVPGPCKVKFTARVVNIYDHGVANMMPESAQGCLKILVKDGTEVMTVLLTCESSVAGLGLAVSCS
jgi:hypothetical protein